MGEFPFITHLQIPKSTLNNFASAKIQVGWWPWPQPVLTRDEEKRLTEWAVDMAKIGCGETRQQICSMVKKILEKDHCFNPFKENKPGKDWWYAFL